MIHSFVLFVVEHIEPLGGVGVFIAEIIEEIIVPIPSALILLTAGFIFLKGALSVSLVWKLISTVAIPGALGLTVGSLVIYGIGFAYGKKFLDRWGSFVGITWGDVEKLQNRFNTGTIDEWFLFFGRATPVLPSVLLSIFCGFTRMPVWRYITITFIGSFCKAVSLGLLGWGTGELYMTYAERIGSLEKGIFTFCIIMVISFVLYRFFKRKMIL